MSVCGRNIILYSFTEYLFYRKVQVPQHFRIPLLKLMCLLCMQVCNQAYEVERGSQFSLSQGFTTKHWIGTAGVVFVMMLAAGGCWAAIQIYSQVKFSKLIRIRSISVNIRQLTGSCI